MADNNDAGASEEQEQQITFNVKSSSDAKYVITVPVSTTVSDLKEKLSTSEYANLPTDRQRLIYSGRVLKDHDTIASCKIKDGNTVHLVRGAESNARQNPANQGGSAAVPPGAGQPANNVPSNIAAGTGAGNPLAQLTGARYAGFHGLPGADMFGADGGMGAPPNPDQMLRLLDDPNFAQQMNEAMNNPAVIDMLRNNPMIRNNPFARQAIENPEFRRMMMNPDMIRMQMQMQRSMGGDGMGGQGAFPMPGQTDTTPAQEGTATGGGTSPTPAQTNTTGTPNPNPGAAANPFAALFPGAGGAGGDQNQANPFANMFGQPQGQQGQNQGNPLAAMTQQIMQNPQAMQSMMQMMNAMNNPNANNGSDSTNPNPGQQGQGQPPNPFGGFNPFMFGDMFGQQQQPQQPPDTRPPEERYADQLRQLNDMGFYEFERNVQALRRSGGSVQGAVEYLLTGGS
jgi:ubiquilin